MDMMDGLAGTLAGMQEDAPRYAKMGAGVLLGLGLGSFVSGLISEIGVTTDAKTGVKTVKGKDGANVTLPAGYKAQDEVLPVPHWVGPVAVAVVGLGLFTAGREKYPALAGANGLGMFAYGVGRLVKNFAHRAEEAEKAANAPGWGSNFNKFIPFGATDTYESPLLAGLGYGPGNIDRYLAQGMNGLGYGAYDRSPGAPTFVESVNGFASAPTQIQQVQRLAAAPMTISGLHGLSATLM